MCMIRVVTLSDSQAKPTRANGSRAWRIPAGLVEIGARLVGQEHRLGVKRVDQPRRDPRFHAPFFVRSVHLAADVAMGPEGEETPDRQIGNIGHRCPASDSRSGDDVGNDAVGELLDFVLQGSLRFFIRAS